MSRDAEFLFPAPAPAALVIEGEARCFPVRRIFCVGQNYAAHAREMGKDPSREQPFFFSKPADAVVASGATIPYPPRTADLHHEIELVAAIGSGGADIARADALAHVFGYAAGVDLTRRDLQSEARKAGRPWDLSKGFDNSAPLGALAAAERIGHPAKGRISLSVDGAVRQDADLSDMIWSVAEIIAILSGFVRLEAGDLIFTGTPAGVGPIVAGNHVTGAIEGVGTVELTVA
ncbi:fumarylacetoacetate hydrolase family protein [Methylosinus sp. H3A]|nr:fumarylacetoacetate hydrolase family protein [Methylosinus sp. H3A]